MHPRILTPPNATEIVPSRTLKGKLFDLGGNTRKAIHKIGPVHVPDDVPAWEAAGSFNWLDPDLTLTNSGGVIRIASAWYALEIPTAGSKFGYKFINRRQAGGVVAVDLSELGASGLPSLTLSPVINDRFVTFRDLVGGLDLTIECRLGRILLHTRIKDSAAPKRFKWRCTHDTSFSTVSLKENFVWGRDNDDGTARTGETLLRTRKREIPVTRTPNEVQRTARRRVLDLVDVWDGRTVALDPNTRIKSLSNEVVYPVLIDPDVTEAVAADADDGTQQGANWVTEAHYYYGDRHRSYGPYNEHPGWRFTTVAIDQAATITAASLTVDVNKITNSGSGWDGTVYGDDVDDAAAWQTSTRPDTRTKTTASYSIPAIGTTGQKVWNGAGIIAIVQEIVNRAGWASGNDMALFTEAAGGAGVERNCYFDDYGSTLNDEAVLAVTFTAGGGAAVKTRGLLTLGVGC